MSHPITVTANALIAAGGLAVDPWDRAIALVEAGRRAGWSLVDVVGVLQDMAQAAIVDDDDPDDPPLYTAWDEQDYATYLAIIMTYSGLDDL